LCVNFDEKKHFESGDSAKKKTHIFTGITKKSFIHFNKNLKSKKKHEKITKIIVLGRRQLEQIFQQK
jgi:hypothetical protein